MSWSSHEACAGVCTGGRPRRIAKGWASVLFMHLRSQLVRWGEDSPYVREVSAVDLLLLKRFYNKYFQAQKSILYRGGT
mgnify:CR=1 FL=1